MIPGSRINRFGIGEPPYFPNASKFDGTNDNMRRTSALAGVGSVSNGMAHFWIRRDAGGTTQRIITGFDTADAVTIFDLQFDSADKLNISFSDQFQNNRITAVTNSAISVSSSYYSILLGWDMNTSAGARTLQVYINDVSAPVTFVADVGGAFPVPYSLANNVAFGSNSAGSGNRINAAVADYYMNIGQRLDFSVTANRRKFISATGRPVNPGTNGERPTGSAPTIMFKNPAATFGTNLGTGGDLIITGTLDPATGP